MSLKKEYREVISESMKEGMIRADMRAESYSITSYKYNYTFVIHRAAKFLNFFSNNYDKSILPARSSSSNRIQ